MNRELVRAAAMPVTQKHPPLRLAQWMSEAIQEIADSKGLALTEVAHELLRKELEFEGYSMGIGYGAAPGGGRVLHNDTKIIQFPGGKLWE